MKSIDLRHRLAAVLLAMCLVVCCALPAFATTSANIVLGRLGSLHVRLYDTHNDVPLRGGELTLYQVASVKRTNGCTLTIPAILRAAVSCWAIFPTARWLTSW